MTAPAGSRPFRPVTHLRARLNFSYVILSFFFLCPHIFARASDLTTRKMPCSLSSQSRMPQFSSGERSRSRTNSHRWELWRPLKEAKLLSVFCLVLVLREEYNCSCACEKCCFVGLCSFVMTECSPWNLTELCKLCPVVEQLRITPRDTTRTPASHAAVPRLFFVLRNHGLILMDLMK